MPSPKLEEVFKTSGIPTYTFVEPNEYNDLLLNLRTAGRGLVIEGPSGIGKTTAVEKALEALTFKNIAKLSARKPKDVEYIEALPTMADVGVVIVDDFHKLSPKTRLSLADYMKTLADEELTSTKVIVVGINMAGQNLVSFAPDLVNRIDVIRFESNPDEKVRELIDLGCSALNIEITTANEVVQAAQGSFYLAQMLARELCKQAGILECAASRVPIAISFEGVKAEVWDNLSRGFRKRCEEFCRGTKMKPEGRGPYLHILRWLAEGKEWTLSLRDAIRTYSDMRGSVGQVSQKGYLSSLVSGNADLAGVMHYDDDAKQLTIEDPQFIFYIRNIP